MFWYFIVRHGFVVTVIGLSKFRLMCVFFYLFIGEVVIFRLFLLLLYSVMLLSSNMACNFRLYKNYYVFILISVLVIKCSDSVPTGKLCIYWTYWTEYKKTYCLIDNCIRIDTDRTHLIDDRLFSFLWSYCVKMSLNPDSIPMWTK